MKQALACFFASLNRVEMFGAAIKCNGAAGAAHTDFARTVDRDACLVQTCERAAAGGNLDVASGAHQPRVNGASPAGGGAPNDSLRTELAPKRAVPRAMTASMNGAGPQV